MSPGNSSQEKGVLAEPSEFTSDLSQHTSSAIKPIMPKTLTAQDNSIDVNGDSSLANSQKRKPVARKRSYSTTKANGDQFSPDSSNGNARTSSRKRSTGSYNANRRTQSPVLLHSNVPIAPATDTSRDDSGSNVLKSYLSSFDKSPVSSPTDSSRLGNHDSSSQKSSSSRPGSTSPILTSSHAPNGLTKRSLDDIAKHIGPAIAPKPPDNSRFNNLSKGSGSVTTTVTTSASNARNSLMSLLASSTSNDQQDPGSTPNSSDKNSQIHLSRPRPIRSCTHCRQQKIKCNALEVFPAPCTRCARADRKCVVDPLFKPHKGGQVQSLRDDISNLKQQLAVLKQRESVLATALEKTAVSGPPDAVAAAAAAVLNLQQQQSQAVQSSNRDSSLSPEASSGFGVDNIQLKQLLNSTTSQLGYNSNEPIPPSSPSTINNSSSKASFNARSSSKSAQPTISQPTGVNLVDSFRNTSRETASTSDNLNHATSANTPPYSRPQNPNNLISTSSPTVPNSSNSLTSPMVGPHDKPPISSASSNAGSSRHHDRDSPMTDGYSGNASVSESPADGQPEFYIVGDVRLSFEQAEELHHRFMTQYLPFLPIIQSNSAAELYQQSQLLFWTVCLTASLSEPTPTLYNSLCSLIKQLAIETCWIQTPRSTHIVQALLILGNWPLPNEKVLDDCSYRFITLAKSLAMQLGLHRGKFIYEFSRTQVSLPDAEKWRTRTWIAIFVMEQVWCANLGLPPNMPMDYLLEQSRTDMSLPKSFRSLACLAMFCSKLVNLMGASVTSPDGTLEPKNRFSTLGILEQELDRLVGELGTDDIFVEIYSLYLKMMICVFSFLPETPIQDQTIYIIKAYHAATRVVTLFSGLAEKHRIIEYPIYIRHPVSLAGFILFRLHLSPLLLPQYVESARQSVVTVHRLFRNMLTAWKDVENDISRTAKLLEKLNFVIITHPELFTKASGIVTRMRSHLTASLFYELIWAIHEARRRGGFGSSVTHTAAFVAARAAAHYANGTNNTNGSNEGNSSSISFDSINSVPGSHVDSVPPLPFYNQITKDDFTTTTTTTPNGTTVTTLVPTNSNSAAQYSGSTIIYNSNGVSIYTNNTNNTTNPPPATGDNGKGNPLASQGVTPLAGLGNPSTMLTTGGPDVAGSLVVSRTESVPNTSKFNESSGLLYSRMSDAGQTQYNGIAQLGRTGSEVGQNTNRSSDFSRLQDQLSTPLQVNQITYTEPKAPQPQTLGSAKFQSSQGSSSSSQKNTKETLQEGNNQTAGQAQLLSQSQGLSITPFYGTTGSSTDPLHLDTLMQGIDWMDPKGDDLLGWMDNLDFNM